MEKLTDKVVITSSLDHTLRVWNVFDNKLMFEISVGDHIGQILAAPGKFLIGVVGEPGYD